MVDKLFMRRLLLHWLLVNRLLICRLQQNLLLVDWLLIHRSLLYLLLVDYLLALTLLLINRLWPCWLLPDEYLLSSMLCICSRHAPSRPYCVYHTTLMVLRSHI